MRVLLRVVACLILVAVLFTLLLLSRVAQRGDFTSLLTIDLFGQLSLLSWLITVLLGPFAGVQLWRLRPSGRVTSAVVLGNVALHQLGLLYFRGHITLFPQTLLYLVLCVVLLVILFVPAVRRVCSPGVEAPEGPGSV